MGYLQGWTNDTLNEQGRKLAEITGQGMQGIKLDYYISSLLIRAKKTAEIILQESGNDIPIIFEERIMDINMGILERRNIGLMSEKIGPSYGDNLAYYKIIL